MAKGITLSIASDTREFMSGVKSGMIEPLDQVVQILREMQDGTMGPDELAAAMTKAQAATEKAAAAAKDMNAAINSAGGGRSGQTAMVFEEIGDKAKESGERVEEGSKVGEAALMNLGFSAMTAGEAFQGPSGLLNSVGSFAAFLGPALGPELALPITLLGVGMAALGQNMTDDSEAAKELQSQIQSLTQTFIKNGDAGKLSYKETNNALEELAETAGTSGSKLSDIRREADTSNVSFKALADAIGSNNVDALKQYKQHLEDANDAIDKNATYVHTSTGELQELTVKQAAQKNANDSLLKTINDQIDASNKATESSKAFVASKESESQAEKDATAEKKAAKKALEDEKAATEEATAATTSWSDALHSQLESAGADTEKFGINGPKSLQAYAQSVRDAVNSTLALSDNLAKVAPGLTTAGLQYVESLGESAAPALAEAVKLGPNNPSYGALLSSWNAAGAASKDNFNKGIKAGADPKVNVDTSDADKKLDDQSKKKVDGPTIKPKVDSSDLDSQIQKMGVQSQGAAAPKVKLQADTSDLDSAVQKLGQRSQEPDGPKIKVSADTSDFDAKVQKLGRDSQLSSAPAVKVKVTGDTTEVDQTVQNMGRRSQENVGPTVKIKADDSDVGSTVQKMGHESLDGPTVKIKADSTDVGSTVQKLGRESQEGPTAKIKADTSAVDSTVQKMGRESQGVPGPTVSLKADSSAVDSATKAKGKETTAGPTSKLKADTSDVDKATAKKAAEKDDGPTSKIRADDSAIEKALAQWKGKTVDGPTVRFRVDQSSVTSALNTLSSKTVTVNVKTKAVDG